jgi:protein-tyrosine phosphatase
MIDLHNHILPGIDDGASNLAEALDIAREAAKQGISHIVCTPHHNAKYSNRAEQVLQATEEFQVVLNRVEVPVTIYECQEVRIHEDLLQEFDRGDLLTADINNRYLFIEFPTQSIPFYTDDVLRGLIERGVTPIIVHPERYAHFQENPNAMIGYIRMGCLFQVTAPSLVGQYGKRTQEIAETMVKQRLVHMVASDAHALHKRGLYLKDAYARIEELIFQSGVDRYMEVAKQVINGDDISIETPIAIL